MQTCFVYHKNWIKKNEDNTKKKKKRKVLTFKVKELVMLNECDKWVFENFIFFFIIIDCSLSGSLLHGCFYNKRFY